VRTEAKSCVGEKRNSTAESQVKKQDCETTGITTSRKKKIRSFEETSHKENQHHCGKTQKVLKTQPASDAETKRDSVEGQQRKVCLERGSAQKEGTAGWGGAKIKQKRQGDLKSLEKRVKSIKQGKGETSVQKAELHPCGKN